MVEMVIKLLANQLDLFMRFESEGKESEKKGFGTVPPNASGLLPPEQATLSELDLWALHSKCIVNEKVYKPGIKQEAFIMFFVHSNEYGGRGSKAAKAAGYSEKSSTMMASKLKRHAGIAKCMDLERHIRNNMLRANKDKVLQELSKIGFANIADFVEWEEGDVRLVGSGVLNRDQTAAIQSVKVVATKHGNSTELKLHDKKGALELMGKHLNMFQEKEQGDNDLYSRHLKQIDAALDRDKDAVDVLSDGMTDE